MNKTLLVSSLSAAALLAGCRVYLPGESPRRTVFGTGSPSRAASAEVAAAPVAPAPAPAATDDLIAPQPVAVTSPAPFSAPAPAAAPATALPQTAGPDSYRNYMGGGSGASAAPAAAPRPHPAAAPVAAPVPAATVPDGATDVGYRMYTVQTGDSAGMIANSNGMTLAEFARLNGLSDPNRLRVGQTVKVAAGRSALAAGPAARPAQPAAVPAGYVVVQEGDTLSAIASRNGTTVKALMEANGISDANSIRSGRQLRLPGTAAQTPVRPTATAPAADAQAAQNAVHPIPTTTRPVATVAPPTTRPVATIPTTTRKPVRVTADEASAAPGGTVQAGDATFDVDAALSGGGLGAARQRAQETAQTAQDAVQQVSQQAAQQVQQVQQQVQQAAQQVGSAATPGTKEYIVQEEDDIYTIAMKFNEQPLRIRALNGGVSLDDLKPGTRILVPAGD